MSADLYSAQEGLHIVDTRFEAPKTMKEARYARTLTEAFGPYAAPVVHTEKTSRRDDFVVVLGCAGVLLVWGVAALVGALL